MSEFISLNKEYILVFGAILGCIFLLIITMYLSEIRKGQRRIFKAVDELLIGIEGLITKLSPLLDAGLEAIEKTKECPECKKTIDEAYGLCPFCSHEFAKRYFLHIIGPGDEGALDTAAKKLSTVLKTDFHELKHRLRMGFDYSIADHVRRREFMSALENMGCSVTEVVKWV